MPNYESPRLEASLRIVAGLVLVLSGALPLLFGVAAIAGVLWMLVDVIVQLVMGTEGWPNKASLLSNWLSRLFYWPLDMTEWILFGTRDFPWLP